MNAIEIKNLCKAYDDFKIDNLSLTLPGGCILGLVGENGAGKSTTIKLILDLVKRDSGSICVLGRDNQDSFEVTKEDIGVVLDEVGFSECFTVKDIDKIMSCSYKNWSSAEFIKLIQRFSLPLNKKFKEFSKGMKMKLGIAAALSHNAKLLILDEATSGLDPVVRDEITDIFMEFTRDEEHTILISSHIVSDLEKMCDYIAFIHNGRLMLCEEKDRLKDEYAFISCDDGFLKTIEPSAIIGTRKNRYAVEAIVKRSAVPADFEAAPITIEELFVFMVKGDR